MDYWHVGPSLLPKVVLWATDLMHECINFFGIKPYITKNMM